MNTRLATAVIHRPLAGRLVGRLVGRLAGTLVASLLAGLLASSGRAQAPENYALVDAFPAQAKFDRPIYIDHHPKDPSVYYVVEQYGRIFRVPRDGQQAGRELFLDWRSRVLSPRTGGHNEEGLLGFAFDPDFADNGHVYIYYSRKTGDRVIRRRGRERRIPVRESVVARLDTLMHGKQRIAAIDSELVVLRVEQPWGNHNGGTIVFGPDKMLYIVLGDGGFANDPRQAGQDLGTLLGSILRIDSRGATKTQPYTIPKNNPFVGRTGARGEIWAYGLRNPWRISFDRKTGELWAADVGQDVWEEVDRIVKGGNYGWNRREGTHPFPPEKKLGFGGTAAERPQQGTAKAKFIEPVAEYHHREGVSITGGYVYRGEDLPELTGQYVYADYQTGRLWAVKEDRAGGQHQTTQLMRKAGAVASFGETVAGEILLLRYDGDRISRLVRVAKKSLRP